MTIDQRAVQGLLDKQEIYEAVMRFCRGVDRLDADLIKSAYHSDGYDDHGVIKGNVDEFVEIFVPMAKKYFISTSHIICNQLIDIHDDVARCESYYIAVTVQKQGGEEIQETHYGRYIDRFEKRAVGWRIAHRLAVLDASRSDVVHQSSNGPDPALVVKGSRDQSDPVYTVAV